MKKIYLMPFLLCSFVFSSIAQNVGINEPNPKEQLHVNGAIIIGDNSLANPEAGTIRFHDEDFIGFDGTNWHSLTDKKYILGLTDTLIRGGRHSYGGFTGIEAVNQICKDQFPDDPTAHFYNEIEIQQALSQGNFNTSIDGINSWTWQVGTSNATLNNNCNMFGHNTGHLGRGTVINVSFFNDTGLDQWGYRLQEGVACGNLFKVICGK